MWFWFVIPSSTKVNKGKDQQRRASNPPSGEPEQTETNVPEHSEPESDEPQQSQPESNVQQQSQPETRAPQKSHQQKTTTVITIPSPEVLPILKPELLCVGFLGLVHNGCWIFVLAYYFVYWAFALDHQVKEGKDDYGGLKVTKGLAIASFILHLIGMVLAGFALRMDHLLRYSTDPALACYKVAKILQHYVITNTVFVIYAVIMFFVVICYIPEEYKYTFIGMMLGSICLRMVCADIVERYLILLAKLAGIKMCRICFCSPRRREEVQTAPSDETQQI